MNTILQNPETGTPKNRKKAWIIGGMAGLMFGFGFALSPLYDVFCDITGLNGKITELTAAPTTVDLGRPLSVRMVARTGNNISGRVRFEPVDKHQSINTNKPSTATFLLENLTNNPLVVRAVPSVVPGIASKFVHKIECFCMREQPLAAKEKRLVTMTYWYESDLDLDIDEVIMGYTLFDITAKASKEAIATASNLPSSN